jgi:sRNA-binding regulator protein Hfq
MVAFLVETQEKATTPKPAPRQTGPQFIPKLKGKRVTIRLVSGGQPVTGTLEGYNPYEILIQTVKGPIVVFKHAIATIEPVDVLKPQDFLMRE